MRTPDDRNVTMEHVTYMIRSEAAGYTLTLAKLLMRLAVRIVGLDTSSAAESVQCAAFDLLTTL